MFNNYNLNLNSRWITIQKRDLWKSSFDKTRFTNYEYVVADNKGIIDNENAIDGNFYQTENDYSILVYYRENTDRYDRVIVRKC
jgi:hypothetical protein